MLPGQAEALPHMARVLKQLGCWSWGRRWSRAINPNQQRGEKEEILKRRNPELCVCVGGGGELVGIVAVGS